MQPNFDFSRIIRIENRTFIILDTENVNNQTWEYINSKKESLRAEFVIKTNNNYIIYVNEILDAKFTEIESKNDTN